MKLWNTLAWGIGIALMYAPTGAKNLLFETRMDFQAGSTAYDITSADYNADGRPRIDISALWALIDNL